MYFNNKKHKLFSDIHQNWVLSQRDKSKFKHLTSDNLPKLLWQPQFDAEDKETILLLAGDIWESFKLVEHYNFSYLKYLSERYLAIIVVLGNHDYFGENITYFGKKLQLKIASQQLNNVHLLDNSSIVINNVRYVGSTLWYKPTSEEVNAYLKQTYNPKGTRMNDFKFIRVGSNYRKFRIEDGIREYTKAVAFITDEVKQSEETVVVLTHMSPVKDALMFDDEAFNGFYANDLTELIYSADFQEKVKLWGFGHIHKRFEQNYGKVLVKNNVVLDHNYHLQPEK